MDSAETPPPDDSPNTEQRYPPAPPPPESLPMDAIPPPPAITRYSTVLTPAVISNVPEEENVWTLYVDPPEDISGNYSKDAERQYVVGIPCTRRVAHNAL